MYEFIMLNNEKENREFWTGTCELVFVNAPESARQRGILDCSADRSNTVRAWKEGDIAYVSTVEEDQPVVLTDSSLSVHALGLEREFLERVCFDAVETDFVDIDGFFSDFHSVKEWELSPLDLSQVKSMNKLFTNCFNLKKVVFPDNISNTASTLGMFGSCNSLRYEDIIGLENLNVNILTFLAYPMIPKIEEEWLDVPSGIKLNSLIGLPIAVLQRYGYVPDDIDEEQRFAIQHLYYNFYLDAILREKKIGRSLPYQRLWEELEDVLQEYSFDTMAEAVLSGVPYRDILVGI